MGSPVPVEVRLVRSERPLEEPYHRVIRTPPKLQEPVYAPISRAELQKRENLQYEYANSNQARQQPPRQPQQLQQQKSPRQLTEQSPVVRRTSELTPSKIYGGRVAPQNIENFPLCSSCSQKHPTSCPCPIRSSAHKIKRLRSSSSKKNGYLLHLS